MKTLKYYIMSGIILTAFSCELLDNPGTQSVAEKLEGRWMVQDNSPNFKSTEETYYVYIDIYEIDSNMVGIDNFFGLDAGNVYATVSGMTLTLPEQEMQGGYTVKGTGIISSNYKTITWQYYVDEGSGTWFPGDAVYTKMDY